MNLICPCCQAVFPLDSALEDLAHRDAYNELLALTPFPELLPGYLRMFAPVKRALSGKKKARLTAELVQMIKAARFDYKRVSYVAPLEYWRMGFVALQFMRDNGTLEIPLQSHNLLLAVISKQINKSEARKEAAHDDTLAGRTPVGVGAPRGRESSQERDPARQTPAPVLPRSPMPQSVKDILNSSKKGESNGHTD